MLVSCAIFLSTRRADQRAVADQRSATSQACDDRTLEGAGGGNAGKDQAPAGFGVGLPGGGCGVVGIVHGGAPIAGDTWLRRRWPHDQGVLLAFLCGLFPVAHMVVAERYTLVL